MTDREVTDWLAKSLWTVAWNRLVADPATTPDVIVTALMLELSGSPFLTDSEAGERYLRGLLGRWWPELQRRAAAIRALLEAEQAPGS